jgi:two-component system, NarL family, nitrate/nitrite response regulator NarL
MKPDPAGEVTRHPDVVRVAIVDEHPVARHGLIAMLGSAPDLHIVTAVALPEDLVSMTDSQAACADVIVCDPFPFGALPKADSIQLLSRIAPVLACSSMSAAHFVMAALQTGAKGYLTKRAEPEAYVMAVRAIAAGDAYFAPQVPGERHAVQGRRSHGAAMLSYRERQVLSLIARGLTHHQIANRLGVSKATVETYVARVRGKLCLGNKAELALAALEYSWEPIPARRA